MANNRKRLRLLAALLICVALPVLLSISPTVLARIAGGDATVHLPLIVKDGVPTLPTETLEDGGVITGPDGVILGAVPGAISAPVEVSLTRVLTPAQPLFANSTPLGASYHIQAVDPVHTPPDTPFVVGIPVPSGAPTANLALAGLVSPQQLLDHGGDEPAWLPMRGVYDAAREMFFVTATGLTEQGITFMLIENPDLAPVDFASLAANPAPDQASGGSVAFDVDCVGFSAATQCTAADKVYLAGQLDWNYSDLVDGMGFNPPLLKQTIGGLDPTSGLPTSESYTAYHDIFIMPSSTCPGYIGIYHPSVPSLVVCKAPTAALGPAHDATIRHEFFHAIQFAYPTVYNNGQDPWVTEGTASVAELSAAAMHRTPDFNLHPADVTLTEAAGLLPYMAQDFWALLGLMDGNGLDYLKQLFAAGAKTQDVVDTFGDGAYLDAYWDWAKNQAIEATYNLDNALTTPCQLESNVVVARQHFHYDWENNPYHELTVDPLSTVVVQVHFDFDYEMADGYVFSLTNDDSARQALEYKFYEDGESGCKDIPDGRRFWDEASGGVAVAKTYYVLISNKSVSDTYPYYIVFELSPIPPE